jgi:ABC-2 type transport system ATP-binding protein
MPGDTRIPWHFLLIYNLVIEKGRKASYMQSILQIQDVTKRIGSKTIIDGVSFEVPKGEVFGLLGPNGAGKTTLIRMMVGLMSTTRGEIRIGGHSIQTEFELGIRQVGAIVENPEMYKFLSGRNNLVHYSRMIHGITYERIEEVIRLVGLEKRIDDKVKTYSLGMRQRLGIAQALLHRPALLILDEPTNGLDPAGIRELRDYLRRLTREEGLSVLVSSHLLSEMELMCDRVAIIQAGKLIDVRRLDGVGDEGSITTVFEVGNPEEAVRVISEAFPEAGAQVVDGRVVAAFRREEIPAITRRIVMSDISIYSIKPEAKTLEDQFLEVTGGQTID